MPRLTARERDAFLSERGVLMRIATVREDGSPLVTPIWFIYEEGAIWFTPRAASEWFACLRKDPRVALCIDEEASPYRKVVIEGTAELRHDLGADDLWRDRYRRIAKRYVNEEGAEAYIQNTIDQERGLYLVPLAGSKVRTWRMPVQGESPTGIWARRYYAPGTRYARES
ncbi:MAG: pyridoxamine 5'-phosphate oxidase family protein [Gammaproteobacteria bacterium]|nr:pyridoxamine 5'-phosphate oxidase family protein [Gammaproteobacteria bacterium]